MAVAAPRQRYLYASRPQRPTHGLGIASKHDVAAGADARAVAGIGVHRVGLPCGKEQERAVLNLNDGLIGVFTGQLRHGRANDAGLNTRIVKIDGIRARLRLHVIDATQEINRVRVQAMCRTLGIHTDPATGDLETRMGDVQKAQNSCGAALDAGHQTRKLGKCVS